MATVGLLGLVGIPLWVLAYNNLLSNAHNIKANLQEYQIP